MVLGENAEGIFKKLISGCRHPYDLRLHRRFIEQGDWQAVKWPTERGVGGGWAVVRWPSMDSFGWLAGQVDDSVKEQGHSPIRTAVACFLSNAVWTRSKLLQTFWRHHEDATTILPTLPTRCSDNCTLTGSLSSRS